MLDGPGWRALWHVHLSFQPRSQESASDMTRFPKRCAVSLRCVRLRRLREAVSGVLNSMLPHAMKHALSFEPAPHGVNQSTTRLLCHHNLAKHDVLCPKLATTDILFLGWFARFLARTFSDRRNVYNLSATVHPTVPPLSKFVFFKIAMSSRAKPSARQPYSTTASSEL